MIKMYKKEKIVEFFEANTTSNDTFIFSRQGG